MKLSMFVIYFNFSKSFLYCKYLNKDLFNKVLQIISSCTFTEQSWLTTRSMVAEIRILVADYMIFGVFLK